MGDSDSIKDRLRNKSRTDMAGKGSVQKSQVNGGVTPQKNENGIEEEKTNKEIWELLVQLQQQISSVKLDAATITGMEQKIKTLETGQACGKRRMTNFDELLKEQDLKTRILTNIIIRQEEQVNSLKKQLVEARRRDIRNNVIISGVIEEEEESQERCLEKVQQFFKNEMQIEKEIKIDYVRRLGNKNSKNRPILTRLANIANKSVIFSNVRNLKGKQNTRRKLFFVNDDLDPEQAEERKKFRELIAENKDREEGKRMNVKFVKNRIVVDQVIVHPKIFAPSAVDILRLSDQERQDIRTTKLIETDGHSEAGSDYTTFVQKIKSAEDIQKGLFKLRIKYGDATHVSCAYRLFEAFGPYNQEGLDDDEFGAGHTILAALRRKQVENTCVYVLRWFGGKNLGARRFEIVQELTMAALATYQFKRQRNHDRLNRTVSQTSLQSMTLQTEFKSASDAESLPDEAIQKSDQENNPPLELSK